MSRGGKVLMKPGEDQNTSLRVLLPRVRGQGEHSERDEGPQEVSRGEKRMDFSVTSSTTSRPQSQKERVSKYGGDTRERHPSANGSSSHKIPKDARRSKMKRKGMSGTELEPEKLLAELKRHEAHLSAALSRFSGEPAKYQQVSQICTKLQTACMQLVLSDIETATRQDIAIRLWRAAHYPTTEVLRKQLQCTPEADAVKDQLMKFLVDSTQFYTTLIKSVQKSCRFELSPLLAGKIEFQSKAHHRTVMMAIVFCHSCYICLGDLSRYQEQLSSKPDWSKPRVSYLKAQQLAPKDGRPYNQLAIVAINAQRRLDAVYFYMRSLMAKNPFLSAHDSLVGLFEETSRKAKRQEEEEKLAKERTERKVAERKRKLEKRRRQKKPPPETSNRHEQLFSSGRKEIWIMPGRKETVRGQHVPESGGKEDGGLITANTAESESTPLAELTKKLVTTFLVAHGKLFTKIGIENFDAAVEKLLELWQSVLQRGILLQDVARFLKMMVINIFSIHHAAERHSESDSAKQYYCGLGLSLGMQFTTTLLEACTKELRQQPQISDLQGLAGGDSSLLKGEKPLVEEEDSDDALKSDNTATSTAAASSDAYSGQMSLGLSEAERTSADITSCSSDVSSLQEDSPESPRLASTSPEQLRALDVLSMLLPVVRVWFDWLAQQRSLWSQFVSHVQTTVLEEFGTVACRFLNKSLPLCVGVEEDTVSLKCPKLWEDKLLAGFMPLKAALSTEDTFAIQDAPQLSSEQHRKQCLVRIVLMARTFRLLSDEGLLGIAYDPKRRDFSVVGVVAEEVLEEEEKKTSFSCDEVSEPESEESDSSVDEDVVVEGSVEEETDKTSLGIEQLKAQRKKLTKEIKQQHLALETQEALLSEAASKASQEVHVAPRYLVPDTNCFVDELPSIKTLLHSECFTLAVPLTVLAELDGLSAGSSERENSTRVGSGAKSALAYLNGEFSSKNAYLRALTTQGSLLASLSFTAEVTDKASNDDLILESCLNLHTKTDKRFTTKGGASKAYSVVLLTDDRNLRVKAHANNLPVRDIPAFMKLLV